MKGYFKFFLIGLLITGFFVGGAMAAVPTADFTATPLTGVAPLTVDFTDTSTDVPTAWEWDIDNDGTVDYTTQNPSHEYSSPGTYSVSLNVSNADGSNIKTEIDFITVSAPVLPDAQFSADVTSGLVPLTVNFTDESTDATSWQWDIDNDGTVDYTTQNATHTYSSIGTYDVALTAINPNGTNTETKVGFITVTGSVPVAQFSADVTSGLPPLTVNFTDLSTGATSWQWDVDNDGTVDYTTQNATHTYSSIGTYDVALTAINPNGTNTETKVGFITVTGSVPVAQFSADVTSGLPPLTVNFTDLSTGATSWQWDIDNDGTVDYTTQNATHTYSSIGTYDVALTAINPNGTHTETKPGFITVTGTLPVAQFSANVTSGLVPLTVNFTDESTGATSWQWDIDNDGTVDYTTQNITHTYGSAGTYDVALTAINPNGTNTETKPDYITVTAPVLPVADFSTDVDKNEGVVPLTVNFTDESTDATSWQWDVNGDGTVDYTTQDVTHTYASEGSYNVTLTAINANGENSASQTIIVRPKTFFTGDRIWDALTSPSLTYKWDYKSFSGFYFDLDTGEGSEELTITLGGIDDRGIDDGDIQYVTRPIDTEFEHDDWGTYQVIGFMAERYFAGYVEDDAEFADDTISLMSDGQLSKVLLDDDEEESVFSGSSLILEDGYALNIIEVDLDGDSVFVSLTKDGDELDSSIVSSNDDYVYEVDLGNSDDVPIVVVHFNDIFRGTETNAVFVEGIFQISDEYLEIDTRDSFGEMEVTSITSTKIEMENDNDVSLSKGKTIDLMGKLQIVVADADELRFAPIVDLSEPGTYELRGTVVEDETSFEWTPLNFEGFYYDIDEGVRTETLKATIDGRSIDDDNLIYETKPAMVEFEHSDWGEFQVIGFLAEKYFAGYVEDDTEFADDTVSILSDEQLSKVLVDEDEKTSVFSGSSLILEEGYSLSIVEVDLDGDAVFVTLKKDGDELDSSVVSSNDDYIYETDLGNSDDVPLVIVHFEDIFRGSESNAVFIEGIFQISDEYLEIEADDSYGEMEVKSISSSGITLRNEDDISLSRDDTIDVMENIQFKVADDSVVRFYPFVEVSTAPLESLDIDVPTTISEGDEVIIEVTSRGAAVSGATVEEDGALIGTTDNEGRVEYEPEDAGTFTITAEKEDFVSASARVEVISPFDETRKISIEVSPEEVFEGERITISAVKAVGGDPLEDVEILFDGKKIGETSDEGTVQHTVTEPGVHKITTVAEGYLEAEFNLDVQELAANFEFSNLVISPLEVRAGKDVKITVDAINTGTASGSYNVDLIVNNNVTDSQQITLDVDESTRVEFQISEDIPGTYLVRVGDQTSSFEVLEKRSAAIYVVGAIILGLAGGAIYMFTAGGWTVEMLSAKISEFIESIRP